MPIVSGYRVSIEHSKRTIVARENIRRIPDFCYELNISDNVYSKAKLILFPIYIYIYMRSKKKKRYTYVYLFFFFFQDTALKCVLPYSAGKHQVFGKKL